MQPTHTLTLCNVDKRTFPYVLTALATITGDDYTELYELGKGWKSTEPLPREWHHPHCWYIQPIDKGE